MHYFAQPETKVIHYTINCLQIVTNGQRELPNGYWCHQENGGDIIQHGRYHGSEEAQCIDQRPDFAFGLLEQNVNKRHEQRTTRTQTKC